MVGEVLEKSDSLEVEEKWQSCKVKELKKQTEKFKSAEFENYFVLALSN